MPVSKLAEGGPAFPFSDQASRSCYSGMTLRDWFAGMAIHGAAPFSDSKVAVTAYAIADAMLAERNK